MIIDKAKELLIMEKLGGASSIEKLPSGLSSVRGITIEHCSYTNKLGTAHGATRIHARAVKGLLV